MVAMETSGPATFVITRDGELLVFKSLNSAGDHVERIDVENGEYEAFFTVDGQRLMPTVAEDDTVALTPTEDHDLHGLVRRLHELQSRNRFVSDPRDPRAVANELFRQEWAARWPRRPGWLDRRLHGRGPYQI